MARQRQWRKSLVSLASTEERVQETHLAVIMVTGTAPLILPCLSWCLLCLQPSLNWSLDCRSSFIMAFALRSIELKKRIKVAFVGIYRTSVESDESNWNKKMISNVVILFFFLCVLLNQRKE